MSRVSIASTPAGLWWSRTFLQQLLLAEHHPPVPAALWSSVNCSNRAQPADSSIVMCNAPCTPSAGAPKPCRTLGAPEVTPSIPGEQGGGVLG